MRKSFRVLGALVFLMGCLVFLPIQAQATLVSYDNIGTSERFNDNWAGFGVINWDGSLKSGMIAEWNRNPLNYPLAPWTADVGSYNDVQGRYSDAAYSKIGFLFNKNYNASASDQYQINLAIWKLLAQAAVDLSSPAYAQAVVYYNEALAVTDFNWTDVMYVLTPTSDANAPEIYTPAPEPATMLLFGTGLIGLIGIPALRRRKG